MRTPDQLEKAFSVRHCFDFHGSERYSLNLHLSGTRKPIRIQHCEPGPDGGLSHFERVVLGLTTYFEKNGVEETLKFFFKKP